VLVPVVLFYLLTDWPELVARSRTLIPPRWVRPIDEVLDADALSACFGLPLELDRHAGRWTARAAYGEA